MVQLLRGANSPLLHCGFSWPTGSRSSITPPRGEFAPPTLRPVCESRLDANAWRLRGANSPLLHCGPAGAAQLGRLGGGSEGRIRPSYIAAPLSVEEVEQSSAPRGEFAPPTLRPSPPYNVGKEYDAPRGEFAPPTLRPLGRGFRRLCFCHSEGRIRPSYIAAPGLWGVAPACVGSEGRIRPSYIAALAAAGAIGIPS